MYTYVYICVYVYIYIMHNHMIVYLYLCILCIYQDPFGRIRGAQELLKSWLQAKNMIITWDHGLICWNNTYITQCVTKICNHQYTTSQKSIHHSPELPLSPSFWSCPNEWLRLRMLLELDGASMKETDADNQYFLSTSSLRMFEIL